MVKIKIANTVYVLNTLEKYVDGLIYRFICNEPHDEVVLIDVTKEKMPVMPETAVKDMIIRGHVMYIDRDHKYYLQTEEEIITYMKYRKDLAHFQININPEVALNDLSQQEADQLTAILHGMFSKAVLMDAVSKNGIWLHCVALKYKDGAILFSAKSKTGKTTHTNFWIDIFPDVEIINGDNGFCFLEGAGSYLYGMPWAGTSEDCMNIKAPIHAIVFLEQAEKNSIDKLDDAEAFMRLSSRCFMPAWDRVLMLKALDTAESLAKNIDCYLLKCLPDQEAARLAERELFSRIQGV